MPFPLQRSAWWKLHAAWRSSVQRHTRKRPSALLKQNRDSPVNLTALHWFCVHQRCCGLWTPSHTITTISPSNAIISHVLSHWWSKFDSPLNLTALHWFCVHRRFCGHHLMRLWQRSTFTVLSCHWRLAISSDSRRRHLTRTHTNTHTHTQREFLPALHSAHKRSKICWVE